MLSIDFVAAAERLGRAFDRLLEENSYGGASLSLYRGDQCLISLYGGEASPGTPWKADTPCLIWSASKGIAAACTLHALQAHDISLKTLVADFWPEFAANGKEQITLAELLSHRAGLAAIDKVGLHITDHQQVTAVLAAQAPNWNLNHLPTLHGYGARTFGFLLDEIVRRITGTTLSDYWNKFFQEPLHLDLWFGLPKDHLPDTAMVIAPKSPPESGDFSRAFADPNSLTRRALSEPGGILTPSVMNTPAMRSASIPSLGAIATADSLARFYALMASSNTFFNENTRLQMQKTLSLGIDLTLLTETAFSAGFITNHYGVYGSGKNSFGHPGAGGSLAFADPDLGIGFAFIPSAMHPGALPGLRTRKLVQALYGTTESD